MSGLFRIGPRWLLLLISVCWFQTVQALPLFKDLPEAHRPAVGKLLVAMPDMRDPHFRGSVILLIRYDVKQGAVGLIINRPTRFTLEHEFDERVAEVASQQRLFWGGPVAMDRRVMLIQEGAVDPVLETLEPVFGQLYLANQPQRFWQLLKRPEPTPFRVYAGYSGWRALQLEREIIRGDWLVIPATEEMILQDDSESLWPQLINYRHRRMAQLQHASSVDG